MLKTVNRVLLGLLGRSPWVAACCSAGWICSATGISACRAGGPSVGRTAQALDGVSPHVRLTGRRTAPTAHVRLLLEPHADPARTLGQLSQETSKTPALVVVGIILRTLGRWGTPSADAVTTGSGLVRRGRHVPLLGRRDIEHRHSVSRRSRETTQIPHGSFPGGIPEWSSS